MPVKPNRIAKIVLLSLATALFVLALIINYISTGALEFGRDIGLFPRYNSSLTWSQRGTFQTITITPAGWTFSVWGIIYVYQAALLGYMWSTVCRRLHKEGDYLCCDPDLAPYVVLIAHCISSVCNASWIALAERSDFERDLLIPLTFMLFGITIALYVALVFSYWHLYEAKPLLQKYDRCIDYWLVVGLVQNGLSLYAGWCTIASFLNVSITAVFYGGNDEQTSSIACLATVMVIVTAYAICDLTILDMFTRFVFTPHIVVIWASCGVLSRNYRPGAATSIMAIIFICIVAAALIAKFVLIFIRTSRNPILGGRVEQLKEEKSDVSSSDDKTKA